MSEEGDIQRAITKKLETRGAKVYRMHAGHRRVNMQLCYPGTPDLFVVERNRHYWIEVKTPTGTVSPTQKEQHTELQDCGMEVIVVRSVEDV